MQRFISQGPRLTHTTPILSRTRSFHPRKPGSRKQRPRLLSLNLLPPLDLALPPPMEWLYASPFRCFVLTWTHLWWFDGNHHLQSRSAASSTSAEPKSDSAWDCARWNYLRVHLQTPITYLLSPTLPLPLPLQLPAFITYPSVQL